MSNKSTVLIIPADLRADANTVAEQMGWGPNNYSVRLSADRSAITHYGLHAITGEEFRGWVEGTIPLPDGMEHARPVIDALIYSARDDLFGAAHFAVVLEAHGLHRWPVPININTADAATLQRLDQVGPVRADQIIGLRASLPGGRFDTVEQLTQVSGIGDDDVARWQDDPGLEV